MTQNHFESFRVNLTAFAEALRSRKDSSKLNLYWMLQDPIDEQKYKLNKNGTMLSNKLIDMYNHESIEIL